MSNKDQAQRRASVEYIRSYELCKKFKVSHSMLHETMKENNIKFISVGKSRCYPKEISLELLEKNYGKVGVVPEGWLNRPMIDDLYGSKVVARFRNRCFSFGLKGEVKGRVKFYLYNKIDFLCITGADNSYSHVNVIAKVCGVDVDNIRNRALKFEIDIIDDKVSALDCLQIFKNKPLHSRKKKPSHYKKKKEKKLFVKRVIEILEPLSLDGYVHSFTLQKNFIFKTKTPQIVKRMIDGKEKILENYYFDCRFRDDAQEIAINDIKKIKSITGGYIGEYKEDGYLRVFYVTSYLF